MDGSTTVLSINNHTTTINELKEQYAETEKVQNDMFDFSFEGEILSETTKICSTGIHDGSEIELCASNKLLSLQMLGEVPATTEQLIREVAVAGSRVQVFLDAGVPANIADEMSFTPLHSARDESTITLLLNYGADINAETNDGNTPLMHSLMQLYFDVSDILIKLGANVRQCNHLGLTPLHVASDYAIAKLLLEYGADVNACDYVCKDTPLGNRIVWGAEQYDILKLFILNGADVNHSDSANITPLQKVIIYKPSCHLASYLLQNGADPNLKSNTGETALHISLRLLRNKELVSLLIENDADVNVVNGSGCSPILLFLEVLLT